MNWNTVKKKYPEIGREVLFIFETDDGPIIKIGFYDDYDWISDKNIFEKNTIHYWKELPKLPSSFK